MDQHDPPVSELLPLMRAASMSPKGPKWSLEGSADSDGEWGPSQSVRKSQRPRNCTPIDSGSESDFRPVVKEEIKIEVTSPRVERPSSPSVSDDDPFSDRALHSLVKEEKYRPRSPSPSEDFIGFTEVDRDSACFISNAKRSLLLGCSSAIRDSTEVFAEGVFIKSRRFVINYRDVDGLDDSNIFCDVCCRDWDGECPVHGPLKIIHDTKARPGIGDVDRDVKTLPPSLSSGPSTNPASGTGISGSVQCPHCDFRCLGQQHLDRHVKRSHGHIDRNGRFKCEWCQYSTDKSRDMKHHRRTHTGERPHRCDICTARFILRSHLTTHMRTHTGERPYGCSICKARFTERSTLTKHMRTHTGERPHGCSICTARFTQRSHLNRHMLTHSGERPHGCSICMARFAQRGHLIKHMRTHTGERPYGCSHCPARFTQRAHLTKHMRTHAKCNRTAATSNVSAV
ncbi:zinc finger protein 184-like [Amphibalanus amphitrite]|uniref:zinc finger protein 184-like n=1 Tax=Amphibalanus amphitrite TaxID=1232801 RepID=UPI001C91223E|nr:zinc finger protein 184-like [Amphibalanus amphitrite]